MPDTTPIERFSGVEMNNEVDISILTNATSYTYTASTDTTVDASKTYYTRSGTAGNYTYTAVVSPTGNPSTSNYYERTAEEVYASLALLFKNYNMALNEQIYNAMYLADDGFGSSLVSGMSPTINLTGDFNPQDAACAYLESIQYKIGADRVSKIKLNRGTQALTCPVTLTSIAIAGGDAGQPNQISITIAFNGKPTVTPRS